MDIDRGAWSRSVSGGAAAGLLLCVAELPLQLLEGNDPLRLRDALAGGALYAAVGAALGALLGSAGAIWRRLAPGLDARGTASLCIFGAGLGLVAGLAFLGTQQVRGIGLPVLPAVVGAFGGSVAWVLGRRLPSRGMRALARTSGVLAVAAALVLALGGPWLVLRESWTGVADPWVRIAAVLPPLALGALVVHGGVGVPRLRVLVAALVLALLALGFWPLRDRGDEPGGLVLVIIDTLRPDRLSTYGYPRETSPHFSQLAGEGTLFTNAVSTAPFTMPSTASVLTSQLPLSHGVRFHPSELRADRTTLAEVLRDRGYATGAVVSNSLLSREWGYDQGFGFYDAVRESSLGAAQRLELVGLLESLSARGARGDHTLRMALRWLRRHREQRFFLWIHFMDPHFPYDPPPPYDTRFEEGGGDTYAELLQALQRGEAVLDDVSTDRELSARLLAEASSQYDGEIAFVDAQLGRLLEELRALSLADRTLVAVTSDHGEAFGEHGLSFEHSLNTHEELMRVPLLLAGPGVPRGAERGEQVSLVDLAPTLLELLGEPAPDSMEGRSFAEALADESRWQLRPAYGEAAPLLPGHPTYAGIARYGEVYRPGIEGKWRMIRSYPWKLIHVPGRPEGESRLFHLESDPAEERDLLPAHPGIVADLEEHLGVFLDADAGAVVGDPAPIDPEELEKLRALGYVQ